MAIARRTAERSVYSERTGLVLGFHGTDEAVAKAVVLDKMPLIPSNNAWDWLGHGMYFWEHSPSRAIEFAITASKRKNSGIKKPAVIGAVIDLRYCLDLLDYKNLAVIRDMYDEANTDPEFAGIVNAPALTDPSGDFLLRNLDCAVIEYLHETRSKNNFPPFDSVKAVIWEGNLLYPNAGFREKNHIQICIRNPNCIKGFFIPRVHQKPSR